MNSTSALTTGSVAISSAMLAGLIIWLCTILHVPVPPAEVAGTIAAVAMSAAHAGANWINRRFPPVPTPTTTTIPMTVTTAPMQATPAPVQGTPT